MFANFRSFLIFFITVCIILGVAFIIIAYGRGYRLDTSGTVNPTGLIVVQSDPTGAQIIIDDKIKTATAATLSLPPGWYTVTVAKDGYQSWSKRMKIQGEVVAKAEALLLPTNPSLTALTATGVVNPTLSPDGSKLAYIIPDSLEASASSSMIKTRPGIWVLDLVDKPLGLNRDARQIIQSNNVNFSKASLTWSPDSKFILAELSDRSYYVFEDKVHTLVPWQVGTIESVKIAWETMRSQRENEQLLTVPTRFTDMASQSARIVSFSPDETRILYEATRSAELPLVKSPPIIGANPTEETRLVEPHTFYVYDIKEDKNYQIEKFSIITPVIHWLPSSRHFLLTSKDKIEILDYDGANRRTAYGGPFWDSFAVPWASGGKIVILTNLNSTASAVNNLYIVNLK